MKCRGGYKYQLTDAEYFDFSFPVNSELTIPYLRVLNGQLRVNGGYAWDGCSGPTKDTDENMTPSLYHDACYQMIRCGMLTLAYKEAADREFVAKCRRRGLGWLWAKVYAYVLRRYGAAYCVPGKPKPVLHYP